MIFLVKIIINIAIVGLFLYSKLLPYKDKLDNQYKKIFNFFDQLYAPIFNFLKSIAKPVQVGNGLFVDMTQIILLLIFLLIQNYF